MIPGTDAEGNAFHDAYTDAVERIGKLNRELHAAIVARALTERERLEAELDAMKGERDLMKDRIAANWLRGLRFALDKYGPAIRIHLDSALEGSDLEQRVDAAENAIVNLESGVMT